MANWNKRLSLLIGLASLGIGIGGLVQPKLLAKLLSMDAHARGGKIFLMYVSLRDILSAGLIWRGRNNTAHMRQALIVRLVFEVSDFLLLVFGRGFVQQPRARLMALAVPPLIVTETLLISSTVECCIKPSPRRFAPPLSCAAHTVQRCAAQERGRG